MVMKSDIEGVTADMADLGTYDSGGADPGFP